MTDLATTVDTTNEPQIVQILPPQTSDTCEIAKGILQVLNADKMKMWSWGTRNMRIGTMMKGELPMPALIIKVSGYQHKGDVVIALNQGIDLYEIHLLKQKRVIKKSLDRVYFDELVDTIDRLVETGDLTKNQYENQVKQTYNWS